MQAVLLFLAAAAVIGARGARPATPVSRAALIALSLVLTAALASLRVV